MIWLVASQEQRSDPYAVQITGMVVSESFIKGWFALQRRLISDLQVAYVDFQGIGAPAGGLVMTHPEGLEDTSELIMAAELTRRSKAPVTGRGPHTNGADAPLRIAYPLKVGDQGKGALVVEVKAPLERQAAIIELLKWGEAWLNLAVTQLSQYNNPSTYQAVIDAGLAQDNFLDSVTALLALLPNCVSCTRVAFGQVTRGRVRLMAVSEVTELDSRNARVRAVEAAMDEALMAGATCSWPAESEEKEVRSAHRELATSARLDAVCTVPLMIGLKAPMVLSYEFAEHANWQPDSRRRCEEAARLVAPLIALRRETQLAWYSRLFSLCTEGLTRLAGPQGRWAKFAIAIAGLLLVLFATGSNNYRVSAPATIEGAVQRAVVAPFDGYIIEAQVRAGQNIARGDLMARMDDSDLLGKRRELHAEEAELVEQHRQAVATLEHSEAKIIETQLAQTRARLSLLQDQLSRTELRAPLDGLVISGDWSRSLGVPISRGDLMFQIAPLDVYRVAIQVSDRDIAQLAAGQNGKLILTAIPRRPIHFLVTDITSLASDAVGKPTFRVEAELVDALPSLRPGMEGIAKVVVGERQRWWILTHPLTDWLRLQVWRWLP